MRLPGSAQEIADVIGRDQALYLIGQLPRCYAGIEGSKSWRVIMYVPKSLKPDHPLARLVGWDIARKLVEAFGGEILSPANCNGIYRAFRDQSIIRLVSQGIDEREVAEVVGVSPRLVRNLIKENPQEAKTAANDNTAPVYTRRSGTL